ncbi:hypothetical protein PM082_004106 [Marasmius tenuissimus]|nr:hypothetical protein PM082_004106 [Marasmius tenuissimus]
MACVFLAIPVTHARRLYSRTVLDVSLKSRCCLNKLGASQLELKITLSFSWQEMAARRAEVGYVSVEEEPASRTFSTLPHKGCGTTCLETSIDWATRVP